MRCRHFITSQKYILEVIFRVRKWSWSNDPAFRAKNFLFSNTNCGLRVPTIRKKILVGTVVKRAGVGGPERKTWVEQQQYLHNNICMIEELLPMYKTVNYTLCDEFNYEKLLLATGPYIFAHFNWLGSFVYQQMMMRLWAWQQCIHIFKNFFFKLDILSVQL